MTMLVNVDVLSGLIYLAGLLFVVSLDLIPVIHPGLPQDGVATVLVNAPPPGLKFVVGALFRVDCQRHLS